jgi:hypothetical protein
VFLSVQKGHVIFLAGRGACVPFGSEGNLHIRYRDLHIRRILGFRLRLGP